MIEAAAILAVCAAQVELRRGEAPPAGMVTRVDLAGVHVEDDSGAEAIVGWERVRAVRGEHEQASAVYLEVGEKAWRALARLERGDAVAAEPLFEELFERYRGSPGPTAALVCEGLLRCRLRRGSRVLALDPWLDWVAIGSADAPASLSSASAIDPTTRLAPALPPIWVVSPSVRQLALLEPGESTGLSDRALEAHELRLVYRAAARFELGLDAPMPRITSDAPGVRFAADIVEARIGGVDARREARRRLESRLLVPSAPWAEAWCRVALGRSYIRETGRDLKLRGVLHLLHAPARFERVHPYLAGAALADASATLRELGDAPGAERLDRELIERYPGHPALEREVEPAQPTGDEPRNPEDHP